MHRGLGVVLGTQVEGKGLSGGGCGVVNNVCKKNMIRGIENPSTSKNCLKKGRNKGKKSRLDKRVGTTRIRVILSPSIYKTGP